MLVNGDFAGYSEDRKSGVQRGMSLLARSDATVRPEPTPDTPNSLNASCASVSKPDMDAGLQPIDAFMLQRGISNHDLVALAAGNGLTHKQVAKARRGRRLTLHMQDKIVGVLNRLPGLASPLRREDCFNYRGR